MARITDLGAIRKAELQHLYNERSNARRSLARAIKQGIITREIAAAIYTSIETELDRVRRELKIERRPENPFA